MKIISFLVLVALMMSCGVKIPFTDDLKAEYDLNESNLKKVQFYSSSTIILERSKTSGVQKADSDGKLVSNKSSEQDRIIIPPNTKCVFDSYGPSGEVFIRFEAGAGRTMKFAIRPNQATGKYYLEADWKQEKGGQLSYGNETYYATSTSGSAYLMVVLKKLQRTKRKDRVVKGMKI
jgi:hypothetical protein